MVIFRKTFNTCNLIVNEILGRKKNRKLMRKKNVPLSNVEICVILSWHLSQHHLDNHFGNWCSGKWEMNQTRVKWEDETKKKKKPKHITEQTNFVCVQNGVDVNSMFFICNRWQKTCHPQKSYWYGIVEVSICIEIQIYICNMVNGGRRKEKMLVMVMVNFVN